MQKQFFLRLAIIFSSIAIINPVYSVNSVAVLEETTNGNYNNIGGGKYFVSRYINIEYCGGVMQTCDPSDHNATSEYGETGKINISYLDQHYGYLGIPLNVNITPGIGNNSEN